MEINRTIDHTLLKADAAAAQIEDLCNEGIAHNFYSVCIPPHFVEKAQNILKDSQTVVCTVIGFPLGYQTSEAKAFEAADAVTKGAKEVDMVLNIGALKDREYDFVREDIRMVKEAAGEGALLKVILETCLLTKEEIAKACELCVEAGADFVKTSTGFSTGGATLEDVALMKKTVGDKAKVKASGGIRDLETALAMIEAGADRLGTSSGIRIVEGTE